jgi:hypothetical protein
MRIPGANLLRKAFTLISRSDLFYYQAIGRSFNNVGQYVTEYAPGVAIKGSWQPVSKKEYEALGLDFQKSYFNLYIPKNILDLKRNVSADQVSFEGERFQVESATDWFNVDGWLSVLCVEIGDDAALTYIFGFGGANTYTNFSGGNFFPTPADGGMSP